MKGERHLVLEQKFEGALARLSLEDLSVAAPEQALERQEILRPVVNQKQLGRLAHLAPRLAASVPRR